MARYQAQAVQVTRSVMRLLRLRAVAHCRQKPALCRCRSPCRFFGLKVRDVIPWRCTQATSQCNLHPVGHLAPLVAGQAGKVPSLIAVVPIAGEAPRTVGVQVLDRRQRVAEGAGQDRGGLRFVGDLDIPPFVKCCAFHAASLWYLPSWTLAQLCGLTTHANSAMNGGLPCAGFALPVRNALCPM